MGYLGLFETTQEALGPFLGLSGEGGLEEILGLGIWAHFGGNFRSIWAYPGGPGPIKDLSGSARWVKNPFPGGFQAHLGPI